MDNDPAEADAAVAAAELIIVRYQAAQALDASALLLDRLTEDARRVSNNLSDPVLAYSTITSMLIEQAGDNPRFLASVVAAAACRLAGLELRHG